MPPSCVPDTVVFARMGSDVQAAIRLRNRGIEAQICEMMSLWTLMPPDASSTSVVGLRTICRRSPSGRRSNA